MGPLEMLYSWQSVLCAVTVVGVLRGITSILDVRYGAEAWRKNRYLSIIVLPMLTILVGAIYAAIVPLRPDPLDHYVTMKVSSMWAQSLCFMAWGAACGQFSTTLYDRAKDLILHLTGATAQRTPTTAAEPTGATEERP